MVILAKKDPSEKEEEEVERNVRKSPSDKAPRRDKERRRIEVEDSDIDEEDPDMSMNYKDIGGSVVVAMWVAASYFRKVAVDFPTEEAFETYMEEHPGADPANHTIDGEPAGDAVGPDTPEPNSKPKTKTKPKTKPKPKTKSEPKDEAAEVVERVQQMDMNSLYDAASEGSPEEQEAARELIEQRKKPLPPGIPAPSDFAGELSTSAVEGLQNQIKHWDAMDYSQNMFELEVDYAMARKSGNERDADYFKSVMDVYEEASDAIRTTNLKEIESPEELLGDIDGDAPAADMNTREFQRARKDWYQGAMFSPLNTVGDILSKVQDMLGDVDSDTQRGAYLEELSTILTDVRDRKMFDKDSTADRLLMGIREADSPALEALDPGDYDFTDPREVDTFMEEIKGLDSADIARLVQSEPIYQMYF